MQDRLPRNELATNAAKYGALSRDEGHVDVTWSRSEHGELVICWTETGGPHVYTPSQGGFGTRYVCKRHLRHRNFLGGQLAIVLRELCRGVGHLSLDLVAHVAERHRWARTKPPLLGRQISIPARARQYARPLTIGSSRMQSRTN